MPLLPSLQAIFSFLDIFFKLTFFFPIFFLCPFSSVFHSLNFFFFFFCFTVIPWLLLLHEKGGSILPLLLKVRVLPSQHRARCRRLWIAHPSLYKTLGTPPTCSSLRYPTMRLLLPLTLGYFLVNLGLLFLPRFKSDFGLTDQTRILRGSPHLLQLCPGEDY